MLRASNNRPTICRKVIKRRRRRRWLVDHEVVVDSGVSGGGGRTNIVIGMNCCTSENLERNNRCTKSLSELTNPTFCNVLFGPSLPTSPAPPSSSRLCCLLASLHGLPPDMTRSSSSLAQTLQFSSNKISAPN